MVLNFDHAVFIFSPISLTETYLRILLKLTTPFIWSYTAHFVLLV